MKSIRMALVAVVATAAGLVVGPGVAQAADTQLGIDVGNIAWEQYTSTNSDVAYRLKERSGADCNFYTGFWADPNNDRYDGSGYGTCGPVSPGYMYRNGSKTWDDVRWRARAWCADFAKFAFYWGGAKYTGLTAAAGSFRTYGINNGTWHGRGSGYVPRKGDAAVYDWDGNGSYDHVAIVTSYYDTTTDGNHYVVGGNQSNAVTHVLHGNWESGVVGYASPAKK
ncbi:CHAP domain-containing protein [Micromonospora matsumotoense]|uniref:CHAP domain-containing protein n=1 Tax=Micromonospora matsumotoense TaxID=121616 RepID=A0A1C4U9I6_9ACTN|nr:CHAP domain-containing protein [Micromonospora matsumotoense]SCE68321.1 CHAP domain-containing protein [Micromonospora matsumotoense]